MLRSTVVIIPRLAQTCLALVRATSYRLASEFFWQDRVFREGCKSEKKMLGRQGVIPWLATLIGRGRWEPRWGCENGRSGKGSWAEWEVRFAEVQMRAWWCLFRPAMAAGRERSRLPGERSFGDPESRILRKLFPKSWFFHRVLKGFIHMLRRPTRCDWRENPGLLGSLGQLFRNRIQAPLLVPTNPCSLDKDRVHFRTKRKLGSCRCCYELSSRTAPRPRTALWRASLPNYLPLVREDITAESRIQTFVVSDQVSNFLFV